MAEEHDDADNPAKGVPNDDRGREQTLPPHHPPQGDTHHKLHRGEVPKGRRRHEYSREPRQRQHHGPTTTTQEHDDGNTATQDETNHDRGQEQTHPHRGPPQGAAPNTDGEGQDEGQRTREGDDRGPTQGEGANEEKETKQPERHGIHIVNWDTN